MGEIKESGSLHEILKDPVKWNLLEKFAQDALKKEGNQIVLGVTEDGRALSVVKNIKDYTYEASCLDLGVDTEQVADTYMEAKLDSSFVDYYSDGGTTGFPGSHVYEKFRSLILVPDEQLEKDIPKLFGYVKEHTDMLPKIKAAIGFYKKTGGFGRPSPLKKLGPANMGGKKLTPISEILNK